MTLDLRGGHIYLAEPLGFADQTVMDLIELFASGHFVTIFSFLFGIGFYLQLERARMRSVSFTSLYLRRSLGLLVIASLATACGLDVVILLYYAVFGLLLLVLQRRRPRTLLIWIILLFAVANAYGPLKREFQERLSEPRVSASEPSDTYETDWEERRRIFREGTFTDIAAASLDRLGSYLMSWERRVRDFGILALLVLGLYVGRLGVLRDWATRRALARSALPWLVGTVVIGKTIKMLSDWAFAAETDSLTHSLLSSFGWPLTEPATGLCYVAAITLIIDQDSWRRVLSPLAPVGRLALTNYLFTGLVASAVIYSWGFGLFGRLKPTTGVLIVLALLPLQALASAWWTRRFQFGPVEWCWRAMTYGAAPPMRLGTPGSQARP